MSSQEISVLFNSTPELDPTLYFRNITFLLYIYKFYHKTFIPNKAIIS